MDQPDFYSNQKYCPQCDRYVSYLQSVGHAYCVECGGEARLFSKEDWQAFQEGITSKRPKGGRPRKNAKKDTA